MNKDLSLKKSVWHWLYGDALGTGEGTDLAPCGRLVPLCRGTRSQRDGFALASLPVHCAPGKSVPPCPQLKHGGDKTWLCAFNETVQAEQSVF